MEKDKELELDMVESPYLDEDEVEESSGLYEHYRIEAGGGQEQVRIDKFLFCHLGGTSRNRIQKAADAGFIMANDKPVKRSYKVKPGDVVKLMQVLFFLEVLLVFA